MTSTAPEGHFGINPDWEDTAAHKPRTLQLDPTSLIQELRKGLICVDMIKINDFIMIFEFPVDLARVWN